ncbi:nitroreductase family protein [Clostridium sp. DJ247]|uniref:nitroreductase family protein n=1 Tax=Clostridium sp. DJ247 TaxID=2726188 RepID=UPI0016273584|nr:nitroreductase family protein [Clostridium sp. DJ247]MBC2579424.1 nitroreductase [Clostridium sp. DJ247]
MDFLQLAKKRYSVRKYSTKQVEKEKLLKILEAGRIAPTGANTQPQRIIVIQEKEGLEKLKKGANVYGAPLALIVCADHSTTWKRPFDGKDIADIDVSIVTDHMMLQATELELGTVWVCYFDPVVIRKEFNLPDNVEPVNILAVGYAEDEPASPDRHDKARKPLENTVFYETF